MTRIGSGVILDANKNAMLAHEELGDRLHNQLVAMAGERPELKPLFNGDQLAVVTLDNLVDEARAAGKAERVDAAATRLQEALDQREAQDRAKRATRPLQIAGVLATSASLIAMFASPVAFGALLVGGLALLGIGKLIDMQIEKRHPAPSQQDVVNLRDTYRSELAETLAKLQDTRDARLHHGTPMLPEPDGSAGVRAGSA